MLKIGSNMLAKCYSEGQVPCKALSCAAPNML